MENLWFVEKAKNRRIVVVLRSKRKKVCERRAMISIGARIPGKGSCSGMILLVLDALL